MFEFLASPAFWGSLATLTFLEVVLGIDNLLFVSIAPASCRASKSHKRPASASGVPCSCA